MRCSFDPDPLESSPSAFVPTVGSFSETSSGSTRMIDEAQLGASQVDPRAFVPTVGPSAENSAGSADEVRLPASEVEDRVRKAHARGLEEGRAAAEAPGAERIGSLTAALSEALRSLDSLRRETLRGQHVAIVELALAMTERIARGRLASESEGLAERVEEAVARMGGREPITIELSPPDLVAFEAGNHPDLDRLCRESAAELAADPELGPGEARVSCGGARVEARVAVALQQFREELLGISSGDTEADQ